MIVKKAVAVLLSASLSLLSLGPGACTALAAERAAGAPATGVGLPSVPSLPRVSLPVLGVNAPSITNPTGITGLTPSIPAALPQAAVPQAMVPQAQAANAPSPGLTPFARSMERLSAPTLIPENTAQAPASQAKEGAAADFSARVGETPSEVVPQTLGAAAPSGSRLGVFHRTRAGAGKVENSRFAKAVARPAPIERKSAFFPLALAGVALAATTVLHSSSFLPRLVAAASEPGPVGSVAQTLLGVAAIATAVVGGVLALAAAVDAAVFLFAMKRGSKVTPAEFKRFLAQEVAAGRLNAGVAQMIRPHRPERTLRDLTFGYVRGDKIFIRPELAASPRLFQWVVLHELHHMKVGRERGPPVGGAFKRLWRRATSEFGARASELRALRGPDALGTVKVPAIERALRETQLSLELDVPYDVLVVNPTTEELKQPALYRSLSGGRARVETIVTPSPQDYLGQEKNARRFKAVVVDRPAEMLPPAGTPEAKRLDLALQQLDTLFILATRGVERPESGFAPGSESFRALVRRASRLDRRDKRAVEAFETKVKDLWRQIAGQKLQGVAAASFVERLYDGLQDRGLAFLSFSPTDPGVPQWERLLRYWEAADGGRLRVARVDLEDGGHMLVVRKVEARVGLWLKPRRGGRIEKSVPDADGSEERRALARAELEKAGYSEQLAEFAKLGVVVDQVFGVDDKRQEIYVTVPRRSAAAIRKYVSSQSISVDPSRSDFEPHLLESSGLHGIEAARAAGVDGSKGTVMVVDTGGDDTHEDFAKLERIDMVHDGHEDWQGHGTHVLGIVGSRSDRFPGMSKGASLVVAKVFGRDAPGAADGPIMGAGSIARERGIDVVNLSFGSRGSSADNLAMFFSDLADEDVIVVASAGNAGPFDRSLSQPAAGVNVISVAAAAKSLDDGRPEISFYSSVGPDVDKRFALPRWRLKPDLTAIGGDVTTRPDSPRTYEHGIGSAKSKDMPRRADDHEDGKHTFMSGTSMASPMVAGIANLVKQALEKAVGKTVETVWSRLPFSVRAILQVTSRDLGVPVWYQGTGLVDAGAAVKLALQSGLDWGWLDRLKSVGALEDAVYKKAELAKTDTIARFEDAAADSETPLEGREAVGNQVAAEMQRSFNEARKDAAPKLLELLDRAKEPVWLVRFQAALALLNLKSQDTALALADAALNDPDARVRRMAMTALGELRGRSTDVLLRSAAEDPRWDVGAYAAYALARRGDRAGVARLHKVLASGDKAARFTAVWLMGQLGARAEASEAEAAAGRLKDAAERGNIRHLAASALTNIADASPSAISDAVVLDLLDSAGPQNLALTRTISKFFPAALRHKSFGERLRKEPLRAAATGFILKHKPHVGKPGALGELVQLLARYLDLPLDFPTQAPDASGPGVAGVDAALGRLDLIVDGAVDAATLGRFEAELRAALPLSQAQWLSVPEHKAYALTLELRRRGLTARKAAALYPQAPKPSPAGGLVLDPAAEPADLAGADLSLVRVESSGGVSEARVLAALERVAEAAGDGRARPVVVALSLGAAAARRESTAPALTRLVDRLMAANVGVVVAAGNEGPGERSLASPADAQLPVVVGAAGETTGIQFYSARGTPGRTGVSWAELVDEASPATLSSKLASELAKALGAGGSDAASKPADRTASAAGVGTGAAAVRSAEKLAELARAAAPKLADEAGRLPDGWFFYVVSQVKRTLRALPSGAAHEVGGGLFSDPQAAAELLANGLPRERAAQEAGELIAEARRRLLPPKPAAQAKRSAADAWRRAWRRVFGSGLLGRRADDGIKMLRADEGAAPANGPPDGPDQARAWWSDPSRTNVLPTVPLYALRRGKDDPGVGKFADLARVYREELAGRVDGALLLPHFATRDESPYASVSLYAVNEDHVDWSLVPEVAARPELAERLVAAGSAERQSVHYESVRARERAVASEAYAAFEREHLGPRTARGREFAGFVSDNAAWLGEYAEYMALADLLGKPPLDWTAADQAAARRDPRFALLVAERSFAQWHGYAQLRQAVDAVHAAGGKLIFDIPMFRAKAGVDAWKRPGLFTDLRTRNPGVINQWVREDWKDLALWNWTALEKDGYRALTAPYDHWLAFGFDGARVDAFHFAYDFGNGQLASGDEPGDRYAKALADVFRARGAFPLAEAFEGKAANAEAHGFVTVFGDFKKLSTHDDPRAGSFAAGLRRASAETRPGGAARFIGYTLGDEWDDPFPVKRMADGRSQWRYRVPLPGDPDYAQRARNDARPRLRALRAALEGELWRSPADVREAVAGAAARFVKQGPDGPEIWAASADWFLEEWGRDAFISLPGLLLATGRHEEAREVIRRFARLEKGGLIPNRIPRDGAPEYNTIDGPLWFVQAVSAYAEATGDWKFVDELRPVVARVLAAYRDGTSYERYGRRNRVFMDADGLISGPAQATWMDADPEGRDRPVTPRHGKAVEINALWYSSLKFLAEAERRAGNRGDAGRLDALAARVKRSFNERFWFETPDNARAWGGKGGALRDVVDGDPHGEAIRPNMLIAVSRGGDLLAPERRRAVVQAATRDLLTPYGLRTLSPRDSHYRADYDTSKPPLEKDQAYHQGTAWPWLLGPYLDALAQARRDEGWTAERIAAEARVLATPLAARLVVGEAGSLPEVFDGGRPLPELQKASLDDPRGLGPAFSASVGAVPQKAGGTSSQAWSVAELLRALDKLGVFGPR